MCVDGATSSKQLKTARGASRWCLQRVYYHPPMVTRPFSSVIGMPPIRGFKNRFFLNFFGQRWRKNIWSPLIDNPFNEWAKISKLFFQLNEMRDEAKTWWLVSGPDVALSYFLKENPCCTRITRFPVLLTKTVDNFYKIPFECHFPCRSRCLIAQ